MPIATLVRQDDVGCHRAEQGQGDVGVEDNVRVDVHLCRVDTRPVTFERVHEHGHVPDGVVVSQPGPVLDRGNFEVRYGSCRLHLAPSRQTRLAGADEHGRRASLHLHTRNGRCVNVRVS